jgi:Aspartate/tyrosine/aromatic aminotransferase
MLNPRLDALSDYPFDHLRALLRGVEPPAGLAQHWLSVGEPRHAPPDIVAETIARNAGDWGRYPPIEGTPAFRAAVAGWLARRYDLPPGLLDADTHVLPVAGTREALYLIAQVAVPERKAGLPPAVLMPNPFYQVYYGGAAMSGAEPVYLPATAATGFLPDLDAIDPATLERTALLYLCSPANPQGACTSLDLLKQAVTLARRHDFVLVVDECYAEIYDAEPPAGALEACAALGEGFANVLVFHSLSKRSSVPGLRSGFVAGDAALVAAFRRLRSFGGAAQPLPVLAAATALWEDETHVTASRALYRAKFDLASELLGNRFGFFRPAGGFFLWLDVGDGEAATRRLWAEAGVRVLPGAYLAKANSVGDNPGARFIRVALVDQPAATEDALTRITRNL